MKDGSSSRGASHSELIGTLKYVGWIALVVLAIIAALMLCAK